MATWALNRNIDWGFTASGLPLSKTYKAALYSKSQGKRILTDGVQSGDKVRFVWKHDVTSYIPEGNYTIEVYDDSNALMCFAPDAVYARKTNFDGDDL